MVPDVDLCRSSHAHSLPECKLSIHKTARSPAEFITMFRGPTGNRVSAFTNFPTLPNGAHREHVGWSTRDVLTALMLLSILSSSDQKSCDGTLGGETYFFTPREEESSSPTMCAGGLRPGAQVSSFVRRRKAHREEARTTKKCLVGCRPLLLIPTVTYDLASTLFSWNGECHMRLSVGSIIRSNATMYVLCAL